MEPGNDIRYLGYLRGFLGGANLVLSLFGLVAVLSMFSLFVFVILDILSRIFLFPFAGTVEVSEQLLGCIAFLAFGYTQRAGAHVRVTAFTSKLPPKWQAIMATCVDLIVVAIIILITWTVGKTAFQLGLSQALTFGTVELPRWIAYFIATLGCASIALAILIGLMSPIARIPGNGKKS